MRVTRVVGAFAAGRIINPRMVRSQLCGGMIWGVSFALHEHAVMDPRSGRPMNPSLGEYHIPVNADVPSVEALLVEERDPHVNALGIKGVGEIGITGTPGTIPPGFIEPCFPRPGDTAPSGSQWVHDIKHDGYRFICRWEGNRTAVPVQKGTGRRASPPHASETRPNIDFGILSGR